jgi:signal transduction histidine kinase
VHTNITEDLEEIGGNISEAFYRVIQEALTNAYRHGGADYVDVSMGWERAAGLVLLRVSDNGSGTAKVTPGNGLTGMSERIARLGGSIAWRTLPGRGFDLGIQVPWRGSGDGKDPCPDR